MSHPQSMITFRNALTATLFISLFLSGCGSGGDRDDSADISEQVGRTLDYTASVNFIDSDGNTISTVQVAVADDNDSRSEGLMDVYDLPPDAGMLFIFEDESPRSFWMANTPLSLDILFVNADMEIIRIHRQTSPYSQDNILSDGPAMYTIEVNAGYTREHDIMEGMRVSFDGI
ncbi:DUF192 domain-containing protein [Rhodohalobacter mucosus]|uniref:DUF192 domain-containing protein n=1 Tax=Rhodohalobacter mucosus TaxID=2079485 RepID=A0A316TVN6_9BACT|nr:DUF192 domain-containing protein [Rhodohalobacter mucosus]PWN06572.1 DUF192 domain-containing protein [Rhodohalobacter mucosus]